MLVQLILVLASLLIFAVYNTVALNQFGVPKSLSMTYYLWEEKKRNLGFLFTGMMFLMATTLMPAWLELSEVVSSWSIYLRPLAFFTCAAIAFVGAAPAFRKSKMESVVHNVAARVAAICALVWCFVVCYHIAYVPLIVMALIAVAGWVTKTWKTSNIYWLEMMAFGGTFATVITELLIQMFK